MEDIMHIQTPFLRNIISMAVGQLIKKKNFKVLETDEPCNECLTECAREGTVKAWCFKRRI